MDLRTLAIVVSIAAASCVSYSPASACSCVPPQSFIPALAKAHAVFLGTVIEIKHPHAEYARTRDRAALTGRLECTIAVERAWKGVVDSVVTVLTSSESGDCGFPFQRDETYVVYARKRDELGGALWTHLCSGTNVANRAERDIEELDAYVARRDGRPIDERIFDDWARVVTGADVEARLEALGWGHIATFDPDASTRLLGGAFARGSVGERRAVLELCRRFLTSNDDAQSLVMAALRDPDDSVRAGATFALAYMDLPTVVRQEQLVARLTDSSARVREAAFMGSCILGVPDPSFGGHLTALIRDEDPKVRRLAVKYFDPAVVDAGLDLAAIALTDSDPIVRRAALDRVYKTMDPSVALGTAIRALEDEDVDARRTAVRLLGWLKIDREARTAALLEALVDDSDWVRFQALASIGQLELWPPEAVAAVIAALDDPERTVWFKAYKTLRGMGSAAEAAIPRLERDANGPPGDRRHMARLALRSIRGDEAGR